jgi:hypothetical protein
MVRTSVPVSRRCTANACLSPCGLIGLGIRDRRRAFWHACSTVLDGILADRLLRPLTREEPCGRSGRAPPCAEQLEELGREHHVAILLALALLNANDHTTAVDIRRSEAEHLRDAQARGVAGRQNRAMLESGDTLQKLEYFVRTEHDG